MLQTKGLITKKTIVLILFWRHSGFGVYYRKKYIQKIANLWKVWQDIYYCICILEHLSTCLILYLTYGFCLIFIELKILLILFHNLLIFITSFDFLKVSITGCPFFRR